VLGYLRERGIVEPALVPVPTQVDLIVGRFVEYLARERGVTNRTSVYWYERIARSFLTGRVDPDSGVLVSLTAGEVSGFC
jgi:YD repeat-containing protein